jgi:hypothetical protein
MGSGCLNFPLEAPMFLKEHIWQNSRASDSIFSNSRGLLT